MPTYDPDAAVFWSSFVDLAYATFDADVPNPEPPAFPDGWAFQGNLQVTLKFLDDTVYFIGFIASGHGGSETAIVFLGTEDLEWLYDADATRTPHPLGGAVETGMDDMFKSLAIALPGETRTTPFATYLAQANVSAPIHIAGHSLGGALTTLTAAALVCLPNPPTPQLLTVYSLASPRIGDPTFVDAFNARVPNNYRIYNVRDEVPALPPAWLGYAHVDTAEPLPPLDSLEYPVYNGWDPDKLLGCRHSHMVYNYMLKVLAGLAPDPSEMGTCYVPRGTAGRVRFRNII